MKKIKWYIDQINESASVRVAIHKHSKDWKIQVTVSWYTGFHHSECFDSIAETKAYLRGFYDAFPF